MSKKEPDSVLISNFEINKKSNSVVLFISSKIFPASLINKAALKFKNDSWVAIDSNQDEILVELKPKSDADLELLARKFNNELLELSAEEIHVDNKSDALLTRIKDIVAEFVRDEKGKISKQSVVLLGSILATLGLASTASASHLCGWVGVDGGGGDGGGGGGDGGCDGDGGGGCS